MPNDDLSNSDLSDGAAEASGRHDVLDESRSRDTTTDNNPSAAIRTETARGIAIGGGTLSNSLDPMESLKRPKSAFQWFQKERSEELKAGVRAANDGNFQVAWLAKHAHHVFHHDLSPEEKAHFEQLAAQDAMRYAAASHAADVAALERKERLRAERETLLLDDEGGQQRTTRRQYDKKQRRKQRKDRQTQHPKQTSASESGSESDEWDSDVLESESDDSSGARRRKAAAAAKKKNKPRRSPSQKQLEHQARQRAEKNRKEAYIAERQQDLRETKAAQAKKRLEFLLQQSDIFSHFGRIKQDTAKYGIQTNSNNNDNNNNSNTNANANNKPEAKSTFAGEQRSANRREKNGSTTDTDEQDLRDADEHEATFLTAQPTTLGFGNMRPYQLEGLNWMIRLQENGVNGILADEMGLGKTLQSISVLVYMMEYANDTGPHLIVVPKSTLSNWMNEIARWAPGLTAVKFHGDKHVREEIIQAQLEPATIDNMRKWNVVVTTYEVCNREKTILKKFAWGYLIIDEAHRLKNEASTFSQTIRSFETKYRLLLTGTPLQNSLHELWALLNFLVPDVFESSEQFDEWFNLDIEDKDEKNKLISQLHKILRPFMLRRLKADVEKSLPPKHETILFTGMSAMQKNLYRDILMRDLDAIQGGSGNRTAILNIVMQLRKCAGHPYLFPGIEDRSLPPLGEHLVENCGKMVVLDKLLKRLKERGHRVLLFTQMTRILDILEDYLRMRHYSYCRIDGNTSYELRETYIDEYNKPNSEKFMFLLSTRAGGLGINLQTADVVILYDSDWNPQADLQAQDRAHRIGQKREVQIFRLVTEHTIEEKIVERAQQKLKLDAMVVQQGRLKDKDKLSRDELLSAVRFGADKIFKSKDSSITDADIDMILDQGKQKTQEMNEKLKAAEKGDMLDFKLDGSSVQTFEGVDYSLSAVAQAKAQAEMLGIFDIGKRERKEAIYNESSLFQRQMAANLAGPRKPKKKKEMRLPKYLRLPRMQDWQMFDRETLLKISEDEENAFKALPEDQQKAAIAKKADGANSQGSDQEQIEGVMPAQSTADRALEILADLPPLLNEEQQILKDKLLAEGFDTWSRSHYNAFLRASARYGRETYEKISLDVGKTEDEVRQYAEAFWGEMGRSRIPETEYDRATKAIARGEKKINEVSFLERATRRFVALFDNPWDELQFIHVNTKDKMFTAEEDRHLLCWARKYGYGQWMAVKLAVRRNPNFRFDYFLRSLPVEFLGKRCEQLMRFADKEIEHYEKQMREIARLPTEPIPGKDLPSVDLPPFSVLQQQLHESIKQKHEKERQELENKVIDLETQINELQGRLKEISNGSIMMSPTTVSRASSSSRQTPGDETPSKETALQKDSGKPGAIGGDGTFVEFPEYNGNEAPIDWKKPFTHFCMKTRREVKASLDPEERRNKKKINGVLKERWHAMSEDQKGVFRTWAEWDQQRYAHEETIFKRRRSKVEEDSMEDEPPAEEDGTEKLHVPKKRSKVGEDNIDSIPKKKRKS